MLVEIDVELPESLRGEWEPVRVGYPTTGESYVSRNTVIMACENHTIEYDEPLLIVRKKWQWPAWLKAEWIAMDADGRWWAYNEEPVCDGIRGWVGSHKSRAVLLASLFDFTPQSCTDWRASKRRNPNHKDAA